MSGLETSKPNDARARRSRDALRRALLELVEEKPFGGISIRQITRTAGVSYPTFFRNYASKEELLEDIAAQEVQQLAALMSSSLDEHHVQPSAETVCEYVHERRVLWTTLLTTGASSIMREEFVRLATEFVNERGQINPGIPVDLAASFVFVGMFEILAWWLRQPEDYPAHNISQFLKALVLQPTTSPLKLDLV